MKDTYTTLIHCSDCGHNQTLAGSQPNCPQCNFPTPN